MNTIDNNPLAAVSTPDLNAERLAELKRLFPDLFSNEGRLNIDELKKVVDPALVTESERYDFRWYGKTASKREAFTPSCAALIYDAERSVNPEKAGGNVIIEGENLEVLKLLNRAYRERIKCIYIDPPYNTGKDFVYSDNYSEEKKRYWEFTGVTVEGVKSDTLSEADGRRHSRWLSMMHSRLLASRYLLRPDGIILLSIDDNEYHNLKRLLDEVFGSENFIATMVWEKGRKNDARFISVGHEYLIVYGKDFQTLKDNKVVWREEKPGAQEIWAKYLQLRAQFATNTELIEQNIQKWFSSLPKNHPSKKWDRYKRVDGNGPWRDDNISWPGGGGPRYDVIHPATKKPCKVPERGWIFSTPEEMQRRIKLGQVEFREDHTEPPYRKSHIRPIAIEVEVQNENDSDEEVTEGDEELATQVRGSYFYKQSQVSVKFLRKLMGGKAFPNPKDHTEIAKIIDYVTGCSSESEDEIILDFFGGSGATVQAVIDLNAEGDKQRQFILVQLPEIIDEKDPAFKLGYRRISDITIDRVKRVIERYKKTTSELLPGEPQRQFADSLGFKVYKLAKSRFPRVEFAPDPEKSEEENVEALRRYIADKESSFHIQLDREPVRDEVLLKQGFMFDYTLTPQPEFTKNEVVLVSDSNKAWLLCLDATIAPETVDYFQTHKDRFFICLELALDTTKKWNLKHHLGDKLKAI